MRYGLIADVHGNVQALEAAVGHLRREGVDGWLCAGDLVGYGPQPNEVVEAVVALGAETVAGNHDLMAIGELSDDRCTPLAKLGQRYTQEALRDDVRSVLRRLPRVVHRDGVVVAHGSIDDPQEYIRNEERAESQLHELAHRHPDARFLVLGHTHKQLEQRDAAGRCAVNPGSVGQSRQRERRPRARCALLDTAVGSVRMFELDYDVDACRAVLDRAGLPFESVHAPPRAALAVAGRVRRLVRG